MEKMGFHPKISFEKGLTKVIAHFKKTFNFRSSNKFFLKLNSVSNFLNLKLNFGLVALRFNFSVNGFIFLF